jgi:hypothetical protein
VFARGVFARGVFARGAAVTSLALFAGAGCASSRELPATLAARAEPVVLEHEAAEPADMAAVAEIGSMNEKDARESFESAMVGLQACLSEGSRRVELMGGSIEFAVKVDKARHPASIWATDSSLGRRATETCMFEALREVRWPSPVGGLFGIAKTSFEFDLPKGVKPPVVWDAGRVSPVVDALGPQVDECTGSRRGELMVTLYVGTDGKAISGGASSASEAGEPAVDCLLELLMAADYPSPGSYPAKVRFRI